MKFGFGCSSFWDVLCKLRDEDVGINKIWPTGFAATPTRMSSDGETVTAFK
jgi:hypothetical protein